MEYKNCLTFVFILSAVFCEQCVNKDRDTFLISNFDICLAKHELTFNQAGVNIDNKNNISNILTPSAQTTCIASNTLSVVSGGVLEAEVYSQSITNEDYLIILVFGEGNNVVGQATFHGENGHNEGWQVLKVTLGGVGHYDGFILIITKTSLNSDILVGSICYSPAQKEEIPSEYTSKPSHYDAPDIYYNLQTGSNLKYPAYPDGNVHTTVVVGNERSFWIFDREDFWTPLTISLAVIIPVVFLALLCWACFALGKSKGSKQDPQNMSDDIDNLPKPYLVPRVKSVYSESVTGSTYGAGNNNIYSV